jgi:hypothetical protein
MINLREYILEKFSIAGNESDKILLFDVDDTLLKSDVQVHVVKDGKLLRKLSSSEFNTYKLQPGEDFDYVEFEDPKILNNKSVFLKYWDTLQREYKSGTHIGILTARSNCDMIKNFLLNNGIRIKDELVMAINDPKLGLSGTIQQKKAEAIKILANAGYNTFIFFDDNEGNLQSAKTLEKEYGIVIKTVKV